MVGSTKFRRCGPANIILIGRCKTTHIQEVLSIRQTDRDTLTALDLDPYEFYLPLLYVLYAIKHIRMYYSHLLRPVVLSDKGY